MRRALFAFLIVSAIVIGVASITVNRPDHPPKPEQLVRSHPSPGVDIRAAAHTEQIRRLLVTAYVIGPPTTTTTRSPAAVREQGPSAAGEFAPQSFLDCVKKRESEGHYDAVNPKGWYGAYQMAVGTWNATAAHAGRSDLVGVNPADASPADQDAMAQHLLSWQGRGPWAGGRWKC